MEIRINGYDVVVVGDRAELGVDSTQFQEWIDSLDPSFHVRMIKFHFVETVMFKNRPRVLFIKFEVLATVGHSKELIPGIVFMRGGSVAILVILECEGVKYTVLTLQPRIAGGFRAFPEIPAGMLDGDGNFSGVAAKELKEETGINITKSELVDLTDAVYGDRYKGVYPSIGACDEFLKLYFFRAEISPSKLKSLEGKSTGVAHEGEQITLKVIPLSKLVMESPDAKALSAFTLYTTLNI